MKGIRHQRLTGFLIVPLRDPMDLGDFGAVGDGLAVSGNSRLIRVDYRGVSENHREPASVLTDRDGLPAFISFELSEGEAIRYLQTILVRCRHRARAHHHGNCCSHDSYCPVDNPCHVSFLRNNWPIKSPALRSCCRDRAQRSPPSASAVYRNARTSCCTAFSCDGSVNVDTKTPPLPRAIAGFPVYQV